MKTLLRLACWTVCLLPVIPLRAARDTCEVNVNVEVTPAGRKVPRPSPGNPTYYFPVVGGYREEGAVTAGEKPPDRAKVIKALAVALAKQGYIVTGKGKPMPSLLLVFHWGTFNPEIDDLGEDDDGTPQEFFGNKRQMLALVGGNSMGPFDLSFEREAVEEAAREDRYFMVVVAYDFEQARQKKKVPLWYARMSTPSIGFDMDDVVQALVDSGAPRFGKETTRPEWVDAPAGRKATVEVGTATVIEDGSGAPPAGRKTAEPEAAPAPKTGGKK